VRQGCVLSPKLFNLYTEKIFNESDELPGCIVGGENFNNLRYAGAKALLAESESVLRGIVDVVRQNSKENGFNTNVKKTKTMVWNARCENSGKKTSPRTSKEVQISGSMDSRRWLMQM